MPGSPKLPAVTLGVSLDAARGKNKDVKKIISDTEVIIVFLTCRDINYLLFIFNGAKFLRETFVFQKKQRFRSFHFPCIGLVYD